MFSSSLPHWQDCHELWSKKRRRQRQSGIAVEEPPLSKVSRKETTSVTSTDTVKNNSSPVHSQPAQLKTEPGVGDAVGQCLVWPVKGSSSYVAFLLSAVSPGCGVLESLQANLILSPTFLHKGHSRTFLLFVLFCFFFVCCESCWLQSILAGLQKSELHYRLPSTLSQRIVRGILESLWPAE